MGCVAGTRFPGGVSVSNPICESCSPRMATGDHSQDRLSIPRGPFFSSLLDRRSPARDRERRLRECPRC
jgi:hypothetical protein